MRITEQSDFKSATPGTVRAVCTRVIDLGTQEGSFGSKHKVLLGWEIEELMDDGRPFMVTNRFTASLSPKSILGPLLEMWRGIAFTDEERKGGYDLQRLLGQPCMLTLVKEGDYVNVKAATKMHPSTPKLSPVGPLIHFDMSAYSEAVYASLSEGLRTTIAKSPEYKEATSGPQNDGLGSDTPPADDIPF